MKRTIGKAPRTCSPAALKAYWETDVGTALDVVIRPMNTTVNHKTLNAAARIVARVERWEDPQYLSRIIFCQMISAQSDTALTEPTGFGISTAIGDSGYSLLVVHP